MESKKITSGRIADRPANAPLLNRELRAVRRGGLRFSVIIPAHNADQTLRRAVESVHTALGKEVPASDAAEETGNLPFYEILIVENGSEDGTEFLGRTLQLEHPDTVRFFHSEKGVSNARNRGLDEARGDWVLFLDADDYFMEEAGAALRDDLHFSATDLIVHSYYAGKRLLHVCPPSGERYAGDTEAGGGAAEREGKEETAVPGVQTSGRERDALRGTVEEIAVRMIEDPTRYTTVWSKLFRRERIAYGRLRFDPALRLSEDSLFFIRYLAFCRRIRLSDRPFYHYSTDNSSAVRTWDAGKEEGYCSSLQAVRDYLQTRPAGIRKAFAGYGMMQFNLMMVRGVFAPGSPLSPAQKISRMKEWSSREPFASALGAFDPSRHRGARYLPIRLLSFGLLPGAAAVYAARAMQNARREV